MRSLPTLLCLLLAAGAARATTPFTFTLPPGSHAVGLRVVLQYDYSRTYRGAVDITGKPYTGERARPIQTLIWYPAQTGGTRLKVGDYTALYATEQEFALSAERAAAAIAGGRTRLDADGEAPMQAVRDAAPASGRYPVLIYAPSLSAPAFENADLCEYVASHGYVVIASPDMGAHTRLMTADLAGVETQAQDISFLIGFARTLPEADTSAVAVAGFSWGGISNLFAAARDNRIRALIMLDGSARYFTKLVEDSKYVVPENLTLPVLFFTQKEIPVEGIGGAPMVASANVLSRLTHCDLTTIRMHAMQHGHFSSLFDRSPSVWKNLALGDYSVEELSESFGWVARYTERFLAARLKSDPAAQEFLAASPVKNGAHPHLFDVDRRPAKGAPATLESLMSELGAKGFSHAAEVYAAMKAANKDFKIEEPAINQWGYALMADNHVPEAIEVLRLNTTLYPDSFNVYDSLAEAYERSGQKDLAIQFYEKSVQMNPQNEGGKEHLKKLK